VRQAEKQMLAALWPKQTDQEHGAYTKGSGN
jgi:hypothetical protein